MIFPKSSPRSMIYDRMRPAWDAFFLSFDKDKKNLKLLYKTY